MAAAAGKDAFTHAVFGSRSREGIVFAAGLPQIKEKRTGLGRSTICCKRAPEISGTGKA